MDDILRENTDMASVLDDRHREKILFIVRSLDPGGAERQLVTLAKELRRKECVVSVAVFYSGGVLETELAAAGIPVVSLAKGGRWDIAKFAARLISLVRAQRPDTVHTYLPSANLIAAVLRPFLGRIRLAWGVRASDMDWSCYDWLARLEFRLQCLLAKTVDIVIVNSRRGLDYHLESGFPIEKTVLIANGIDVDRFKPGADSRRKVRQQWQVADDEPLIGLVGRIDPMKGHKVFLAAAALALEKHPRWRFVCVGGGAEAPLGELKRLAAKLGLGTRLVWAGRRDDMAEVYNATDLVTSASLFGEGFPNVIAEAMACGRACVVTDVGDSAAIVGDTGIVVPANDAKALVDGWERLLLGKEDLGDELSAAARARIVEHFSTERLVQRTMQALQVKS